MLVLLETPAGYALFKVLSEKKLRKVEDIWEHFETQEAAQKVVSLVSFSKFKNTKDAVLCTNKLLSGKLSKKMRKFLQTNIISKNVQENLAIQDKKLASTVSAELGISVQALDTKTKELYRGLRSQMCNLIEGLREEELNSMRLGLAHGLSRYKLRFSIDKVDTMIIQAISLLDDLEKELNNYMMRLREWYGWHFPELAKIVTDNLIYAKTVRAIGMRNKTAATDLSEILPEDVEKEVKDAAEISMGTEINDTDEKYILNLCSQIVKLSEFRASLSEYLKNRMTAVAPNLTTMVGDLVGARLISHAGSLMTLAKYPASTVQILGAEKALFKAIRTKHATPKYGLIYQANLVNNTPAKIKGKISRALAAKCSLCVRYDALGECEDAEFGVDAKNYIQKRISFLEGAIGKESQRFPSKAQPKKLDFKQKQTGAYNQATDFTALPSLSSTFKKAGNLQETKRKKSL